MKELTKEIAEAIMNFRESLDNMDIETRETKIQEFTEMLAQASKKELGKSLKLAFKTGLLTQKEYESKWKKRYLTPDGIDGLSVILTIALLPEKEKNKSLIVTTDDKELKEAKLIEERFGVKVISSAEASKRIKKEMKKERN